MEEGRSGVSADPSPPNPLSPCRGEGELIIRRWGTPPYPRQGDPCTPLCKESNGGHPHTPGRVTKPPKPLFVQGKRAMGETRPLPLVAPDIQPATRRCPNYTWGAYLCQW